MTADRAELSELLGPLYEGLAFPERWPDFLSQVANCLHCDKAAILFHGIQARRPTM